MPGRIPWARVVNRSVIHFVVKADHTATVYVAHIGLASRIRSTVTQVARLASFHQRHAAAAAASEHELPYSVCNAASFLLLRALNFASLCTGRP